MRLMMLALIGITLSGCALLPKQTIVLGGIKDVVDVAAGAEVCNVPLPTNEPEKTYCIVTSEPMRLISLKAWNRLEKYNK